MLFATRKSRTAGPIFTSYLGTLLLSSCYLSLGILFSAMTENQIVAGALTFAAGLFFWLISWATQSAGPVWSDVLKYLSLIGHYQQLRPRVCSTRRTWFSTCRSSESGSSSLTASSIRTGGDKRT